MDRANIVFSGKEYQDIAAAGGCQFAASRDDVLFQFPGRISRRQFFRRLIAYLDWIGAPFHIDDRNTRIWRRKVLGESLCVDRGRGDYQLELGPFFKNSFQITQQEIDVKRTFVGFVDNDEIVLIKEPVACCMPRMTKIVLPKS